MAAEFSGVSIVNMCIQFISFAIMLGMVFHFGKAGYQDLYTEERKSVQHRRRAPLITRPYKLVTFATFYQAVAALLYCLALPLGTLAAEYDIIESGESGEFWGAVCDYSSAFASMAVVSKIMVYYIFELRLYLVYHGTKYDYRVSMKLGVTSLITIYGLGCAVWSVVSAVYGREVEYFYAWKDDETPHNCTGTANAGYIWMVVLFDVGFNIIYLYLFIRPIRDVIKNVQGSQLNIEKKSKLSRKMIAVGLKVMILSVVLFVSSLVTGIVYTNTPFNLYTIDNIINSACLMLMTPYFPDGLYFRRLCKSCLFCCDKYKLTRELEMVPPVSPNDDAPESPDAEPTFLSSTKTDQDTEKSGAASATSNQSSDINTGISIDTASAVGHGARLLEQATTPDSKPNSNDKSQFAE